MVVYGFTPRSALESGLAAIPRVERIFHAIHTSKYSIHDLSRCRGESDGVLARFNMPLELGMAMFRRFVSDEKLAGARQAPSPQGPQGEGRGWRWVAARP